MRWPTRLEHMTGIPHMKWLVMEDDDGKHRRYLHFQGRMEKLDPNVNFGPTSLSPVLEHAGIEYSRIALSRGESSFDSALAVIQAGTGIPIPGDGTWYPVVPYVRDEGFCAVLLRYPVPFEKACEMFGFRVAGAKPSLAKRIKRHLATGQTAMFGHEVHVRQLNDFDTVHDIELDEGGRISVAIIRPSGRWAEDWLSGHLMISPRFASKLVGHRMRVGDGLIFTGLTSSGQLKGNAIVWPTHYDVIAWDPKEEIVSNGGLVYLSALMELHGGPARTDIQTAVNLDLAKIDDGRMMEHLQRHYIQKVFADINDADAMKETIGFYRARKFDEVTGLPKPMSQDKWKIWKLLDANVPNVEDIPFFRRAYALMMLKANHDPMRFRIPFIEPEDLASPAADFYGNAVRRYLCPDPFMIDPFGYPHKEDAELPDKWNVYLSGFGGELTMVRNPNSSQDEAVKGLHGFRSDRFRRIDRGVWVFTHPDYSTDFNDGGADYDDSMIALLSHAEHFNTLPEYPKMQPPELPKLELVWEFTDAPIPDRFDARFIAKQLVVAKQSRMGLGFVVNQIVAYNALWNNKGLIVEALKKMPQTKKVLYAIKWMEDDLYKCKMPMVAAGLEQIIDGIKMTGMPTQWANAIINGERKYGILVDVGFRQSVPVLPEFFQWGGYLGQGRVPQNRIGTYDEPVFVETPTCKVTKDWVARFKRAMSEVNQSCWFRVWQVPVELRTFQSHPAARGLAKQARAFYSRTFQAKKDEFWAKKDVNGKLIRSEDEAAIQAYLFAEKAVHSFIKSTGLYVDVYVELIKIVYDGLLAGTPSIDANGVCNPVPDAILGGPHTIDGFIDALAACGLTSERVSFSPRPVYDEDGNEVPWLIPERGTVVVERTSYDAICGSFRLKGKEACLDNVLGFLFEPLPPGEYQLDHGCLLVPSVRREAPAASPILKAIVVNGWQDRLAKAKDENERLALEADRSRFLNLAGLPAYAELTTYNDEPAANVVLDTGEQIGWISKPTLNSVVQQPGMRCGGVLCTHTDPNGRASRYVLDFIVSKEVDHE